MISFRKCIFSRFFKINIRDISYQKTSVIGYIELLKLFNTSRLIDSDNSNTISEILCILIIIIIILNEYS